MKLKAFYEYLELKNELVDRIYGAEELQKLTNFSNLFFYTGKGPSNDVMHMGHYLTFEKFAALSKKSPTLIQISSDQKRSVKPIYIAYDKAKEYNVKFTDTLHNYFNWNYNNTYLINNLDPHTNYLLNNCANYISRFIKLKTILGAFGNVNIFTSYFVALQLAPILLFQKIKPSGQCVLITADDQKACFLLLRDIARKLGLKAPIVVILKGLKDTKLKNKMCASTFKDAITVAPSLNHVALKKAISAPFVDGRPDHQNDYIAYFMKYAIDSNFLRAELEPIYKKYKSGNTAQIKLEVLEILERHFKNKELLKRTNNKFKAFIPKGIDYEALVALVEEYQSSYLRTQNI